MRRLILAAVMAWTFPALASAQISPGPLSRAHQSLDGTTQCAQCHGRSPEAMTRLCTTCHREVAWLVAQSRGLHARSTGRSCASCHPEHAGRDFQLVAWPSGGEAHFDHRTAGWPLDGKHATTPCEKCHTPAFRTGPAAALSPRKGTAGWMGLETTCVSCHRRNDPHANALGGDCQRCHLTSGWKPASRFDHATSRYPLTGKHADVACDKCHLAPALPLALDSDGRRIPRFRPLAFAECSSCHADPHRGALGARCGECHVTQGFDVLDRRGFNHAATRFPLLGKHRSVSCEACHGRDMARPKPAFESCAGCHADVHAGEAMLTGARVDCRACHDVDGFRPATFTVAQHGATGFPLGGKHAATACSACHTTTGSGDARVVHLRLAAGDCASCHADPHGNQLPKVACATCHVDAGWTTIRYDRALHATTPLPLDGAHGVVACRRCHGPARPGLPALAAVATGAAGVVFRIAEVRCAACHANPHQAGGGAPGRFAACDGCHNSAGFSPATTDVAAHARYRFPLEGAHRATPCAACHANFASTPGRRGATLIGSPAATPVALGAVRGTTCAACHQGPHGAQFAARPDSGRCDACHGTDAFAGATRFNHDRDAAFPLAGAHAQVPCARCHRTTSSPAGSQVIYRPVPHRCEDCHAAGKPGRRG